MSKLPCMGRFREVPLAKEQALMPTFPDAGAAAKLGRPSRLQPSPDPRLQGNTIATASNATLAQRTAEVGSRLGFMLGFLLIFAHILSHCI